MSRKVLGNARSSKKDEFYTLYNDVKFELDHYIDQFKDKVIYCPCDPASSAFVKYFLELESKGLIKEVIYTSFKNGIGTDCLSECAVDGYRHSDIIVTNPPFSLFRPFVELLDSLNKKFILWGNQNAISYRIIAKLLKNNRIRLGYICNKTCEFEVPPEYSSEDNKVYDIDGKYYCKVPACSVFTNLDVTVLNPLILENKYDPNVYCKYDNYNAINVNKTKDIPYDYDGLIGVPITYLSKHDPSKYNIVGVFNNFVPPDFDNGLISGDKVEYQPNCYTRGPIVNGSPTYARIIIKKV